MEAKNKVFELLRNRARFARRGKHDVWQLDNGRKHFTPITPSDPKSWDRNLIFLKRRLGLIPSFNDGERRQRKKKCQRHKPPATFERVEVRTFADKLAYALKDVAPERQPVTNYVTQGTTADMRPRRTYRERQPSLHGPVRYFSPEEIQMENAKLQQQTPEPRQAWVPPAPAALTVEAMQAHIRAVEHAQANLRAIIARAEQAKANLKLLDDDLEASKLMLDVLRRSQGLVSQTHPTVLPVTNRRKGFKKGFLNKFSDPILVVLRARGPLFRQEILEALNTSEMTAEQLGSTLEHMFNKGLIEKVGQHKPFRWKVVDSRPKS